MIAAVLLDLYETLVTEGEATVVRASSLGERLGLDDAAFRRAWRSQRFRVIRGQVSFADALVEVGTMLGGTPCPAMVDSLRDERCREKSALFDRFDPQVLATLRQLCERGVKLAVVSNCFVEDVQAWPQCAAAQWFDAAVFSFDVGAAKPEPKIYLEATSRLGVNPTETLFVGDGGDDELPGAVRAGLRSAQAAWFRGEIADRPASIPRLQAWPAVLDLVAAG